VSPIFIQALLWFETTASLVVLCAAALGLSFWLLTMVFRTAAKLTKGAAVHFLKGKDGQAISPEKS